MRIPDLKKSVLVEPPPFRKIVGPGIILLGLGLGVGELILWPYLAANYGLGIMWGAVVGITMQWLINMEISRYTLATGESVFVGMARKWGAVVPWWFLISTLVPWMWPGLLLAGSRLFSAGVGFSSYENVGVVVLLLVGVVITIGPVLYNTQERLLKLLLSLGIPFVVLLVFWVVDGDSFEKLMKGVVGMGEGFWFLPKEIKMSVFLSALVFSGAGGNLNLGQSQNVKDKGLAMAHGSGRITSLITGKKEEIKLTGQSFEVNQSSLKIFEKWWKLVSKEQWLVFWVTGLLTMMLLAVLAYRTIYGKVTGVTGVDFVVMEAEKIGVLTNMTVAKIYLVILGVMLFATQLTVLVTTSKIMAENLAIIFIDKFKTSNIPKYFYVSMWIQIAAMLTVLKMGFREPFQLVLTSAVLNSWTMIVYTGMIFKLNTTELDERIRPGKPRRAWLLLTMGVFLFFGVQTILQYLRGG